MIEPRRYALVFAVLATASLLLAWQSLAGGALPPARILGVVEAYIALSLYTLAGAYALKDAEVPIEDALHLARCRPFLDVLLLPYRAVAWLVVFLMRRFDSMEMMHSVGTRLYVGRAPRARDRARLEGAGVTSVLNLCVEIPPRTRRRVSGVRETVYLPVLDGAAPSPRQFEQALEWITRRHAEGHTVLVHCAQGRGRSVTIAAAALCRLGLAEGPEEALSRITAARPNARPSRKQRVALRRYLAQAA
jgi:hypothetical protein